MSAWIAALIGFVAGVNVGAILLAIFQINRSVSRVAPLHRRFRVVSR